ncbi:Eukaryotic aspartyl protease family protein [Acanthocheilonema viteae]
MEITSDEEPEEAVRELVLLWTLSLASTRFYGCAEDGGIGAARPRLVPEPSVALLKAANSPVQFHQQQSQPIAVKKSAHCSLNSILEEMMRDTFVNLAVILCSLLTTSIFAKYNIELKPVFSESRQHTGYSAKMISHDERKKFNLLLDTSTAFTWVPQCPRYDLRLPNNPSYVHEFCANKQHHERYCSEIRTVSQNYGSTSVSACIILDQISFPCMKKRSSLALYGPLGLLKALEWNEWKDYQGIDGVLGLAALHIDDRGIRGVSALYDDQPNVHYSLVADAVFNANFKWPIAIALPPLNSRKKAVLTLGGVNDELCNMSQTTIEPLLPFISVPEEFLQKIAAKYNAQNENNTYLVDCNIKLKPFVMGTFRAKYIIPRKNLLIKKSEGDTRCVLLLKSAKTVALGLPFLHRYCAVLTTYELYHSRDPWLTTERGLQAS